MGYSGGTTPWPTYQSIGDHTEAMRVVFDPRVVSFEALVRKFWDEHQPMPPAFTGTQYRSAIWYHSDAQRESCERVRRELSGGRETLHRHTKLEPYYRAHPFAGFFKGEEYHQKYIAKAMGTYSAYEYASGI